MAYVTTLPELLTAAAGRLQVIGSAVGAANATAAVATTGVVPAAADEVSAMTAARFAAYGQAYQAIGTEASLTNEQFVSALDASANSYAATEAANMQNLNPTSFLATAAPARPAPYSATGYRGGYRGGYGGARGGYGGGYRGGYGGARGGYGSTGAVTAARGATSAAVLPNQLAAAAPVNASPVHQVLTPSIPAQQAPAAPVVVHRVPAAPLHPALAAAHPAPLAATPTEQLVSTGPANASPVNQVLTHAMPAHEAPAAPRPAPVTAAPVQQLSAVSTSELAGNQVLTHEMPVHQVPIAPVHEVPVQQLSAGATYVSATPADSVPGYYSPHGTAGAFGSQ
jgi:hypothetical protein